MRGAHVACKLAYFSIRTMMKQICKSLKTVFLILAVAAGSSIQASDWVEKIDQFLKKSHRNTSFHGSLIVQKGEETLYKKASGLANREWNISHTLDSKFMIASLTKQFTAYSILNLESQGLLSIDDSIADHIKLPRRSEIESMTWRKSRFAISLLILQVLLGI